MNQLLYLTLLLSVAGLVGCKPKEKIAPVADGVVRWSSSDVTRFEKEDPRAPWRYLRRSGKGRLAYRTSTDSIPYVEDAQHADYDISRDGTHWVHILGERCFSDFQQALIIAILETPPIDNGLKGTKK